MRNCSFAIFVLSALLIAGCASSSGKSVEQKRAAVESMRSDVLSKLYTQKPDVQQQIASSAGYAVFDNANVNVIIASFGGGYGVAVNRQTGAKTYMNMAEAGIGFGIGAKDFSVVMVFHTSAALQRFIEHGWAFGGNADAAAKHKHQGGAVAAEVVVDDVTVYSLTETGLALQAVLKGTKFWVDDELN
ncbi:YSC84-related protein [Pseudoalteromonas sp. A25]|uniref:lipid-binding SYLF domain-containing protein n=1 Tax=Pseudoalteromonas sp. A25 TaxID=116092 RepID=UPI001260B2AD|nr:YSC84-related protein [Pseudoalteromonas sp. A25]